MNKINEKTRLCKTRMYKASNCNNKVRKIAQNKFEKIFLCGKHAFNYSVVTQNKLNSERIQETIFPNRKQALCFFLLTVNKYN